MTGWIKWMGTEVAHVMPIVIGNDGPEIATTNYWTSRPARDGICYLSGNAGTLRLLVPQVLADKYLPEMRTGRSVSIESSIASPLCIDIVFQDGTKTPFYVALDRRQVDRLGGTRNNVPFTVWTPQGKVLSLNAVVKNIPPYSVMRVRGSSRNDFLPDLGL